MTKLLGTLKKGIDLTKPIPEIKAIVDKYKSLVALDIITDEVAEALYTKDLRILMMNSVIKIKCPCGNNSKYSCGKCMVAKYCSKECQKENWPEHKSQCIKPKFDKFTHIYY